MTSASGTRNSRDRTRAGSVSLPVRLSPDELALLDRIIAERQPGLGRPEALRLAFLEWAGAAGVEAGAAATDAQMAASAAEVRVQAGGAADDAMVGIDATGLEKAARRSALVDEPAVVSRARGKGRGKS